MLLNPKSIRDKKSATMVDITITTRVPSFKSACEGQVTDFISARTSRKKSAIFSNFIVFTSVFNKQAAAACGNKNCGRTGRNRTRNPRFWRPVLYQLNYCPATFIPQRLALCARYVSGRWGRTSSAPSCSGACACFWS